jgi:hypothetical protein
MTDSTIGVTEPGTPTKLLQSYQNIVSGQTVQAEGVVQVDFNGVPVPRGSSGDPVRVDPTGTTIQPTSLAAIPNPSNLPFLSTDSQGSLQVNSNNLRAVEESIMMLAELAALNSLIASNNGPGARNYQELR